MTVKLRSGSIADSKLTRLLFRPAGEGIEREDDDGSRDRDVSIDNLGARVIGSIRNCDPWLLGVDGVPG